MVSRILKRKKTLRSVKGTHYSTKLDKKRKAMPPGKRVSATGKIYYEYRRNRADKDRRKKL